jgi:hypothetical protein
VRSPETESLDINFSEGLNIISTANRAHLEFYKKIPFQAMYGLNHEDNLYTDCIPCFIDLAVLINGREVHFINDEGVLSIREKEIEGDLSVENLTDIKNFRIQNTFTDEDFILSSMFDPELILKKHDPVFSRDKLKSFFVKKETEIYNSSFFSNPHGILKDKEKELTDLNRNKQLLELKKMKREKLRKEINISEKELFRLEKKREAVLKYKSLLHEIKKKAEEKNRLSAKINNYKKNLIEIRDIQERSDSIATKLSERFPYFFEKGFDQLPDLHLIQESFNKYRDLNEQIDIFFVKKKRFTGLFIRIIQAIAIFSLVSAFFILLRPLMFAALPIISAGLAITALFLAAVYFFKVREFRPIRLIENKKQIENELIEILKKNQFIVDDCINGEIYELLFQYFNDFISYRDFNSELVELKKKLPGSSVCDEKEKKLDSLIDNAEETEKQIKIMIENLDESIYSRPEIPDINDALADIEELIEDNGKEIFRQKQLIEKFETEIAEYDKIENSGLSVGKALADINQRIDECMNFIDHMNFLIRVFNSASDEWFSQEIETLCRISALNYQKLSCTDSEDDQTSDKIKNIFFTPSAFENEDADFLHKLSLSVKVAISQMLKDGYLPPLIIIDPCLNKNEFASSLNNLLLELLPQRQVIIILPGENVKFEGNLITI